MSARHARHCWQARIYWDLEHYPMVEKIFRQSAEFCSEHEVWVLNVAHVFFLQARPPAARPLRHRDTTVTPPSHHRHTTVTPPSHQLTTPLHHH